MKNRKLTLFSWRKLSRKLLESVQKRYKQVLLQWNSLIFSKFSSNDRIWMFVHCDGPKLPKCENTEKSRTDGAFMGKQCLYTENSVETRLEHGFHRIHVFPVKMTFCTLFSLLQLIKRFWPHIVKNRKLTLIFMGKLRPNYWNQCKSTL